MAITKEKKHEIVKELKEELKKARLIIFVNFHGLSVSSSRDLRKILRGLNTGYVVAKKSLIRKALEEFGFAGQMPELGGEMAMAFSEEESIEPIKALNVFSKKNGIKLAGGIFENKYIDNKTVIMLANIPPREVLLAQFVNVINSPVQGLVVALNDVSGKFVRILNQIKNVKT